jgi:chromate transporter
VKQHRATSNAADRQPDDGSAAEVLRVFLKLGSTSFGGPIAHLGYFRTEFVDRLRWLDEASYAELVALCQFLPGPASSQVGIAIGLRRAGWPGALAAWVGFTLPSAVLMILFAIGVTSWSAFVQSGAIQGLKLAALAVVGQAVWHMARSLCPDLARVGIALIAGMLGVMLPSVWSQVGAILLGGMLGLALRLPVPNATASRHDYRMGRNAALGSLLVLVVLLATLPVAASWFQSPVVAAVSAFYRAGALVFGGGHVVLPLLQAGVVPPGWISNDAFLAGYGAAQAVPGPLFSFAAYLGAASSVGPGGWWGGLLMLVAIFLPAFLIVVGALPFWEALRTRSWLRRAMAGFNAAVVGVLAGALYHPMWTSTMHDAVDVAIVLAGFGLLMSKRASPALVVLACGAAGWFLR